MQGCRPVSLHSASGVLQAPHLQRRRRSRHTDAPWQMRGQGCSVDARISRPMTCLCMALGSRRDADCGGPGQPWPWTWSNDQASYRAGTSAQHRDERPASAQQLRKVQRCCSLYAAAQADAHQTNLSAASIQCLSGLSALKPPFRCTTHCSGILAALHLTRAGGYQILHLRWCSGVWH